MSKDDIAEYIREQMEDPTEIDEEDLSPPVCTWCGDELGPDMEIEIWDIPEHNNESVVYRHRYCSEECQSADENAVVNGEDMHPHGEPERLTELEREMMTDGGVDQTAGTEVAQIEMPDGTVIDDRSSAYHDEHGSVTVLNIKKVAGTIEVKFHVEPGRDDKTFTLSKDQLRTRWETRIASTPADLSGRDF